MKTEYMPFVLFGVVVMVLVLYILSAKRKSPAAGAQEPSSQSAVAALREEAKVANTYKGLEAILPKLGLVGSEDDPEAVTLAFEIYEKMLERVRTFDEGFELYNLQPEPHEAFFDVGRDERFARRALALAETPQDAHEIFSRTPAESDQEHVGALRMLELAGDDAEEMQSVFDQLKGYPRYAPLAEERLARLAA